MSRFFTVQTHASVEPADVRGATLESLARPLRRFGYRLISESAEGVTFERPYWTWTLRLSAPLWPILPRDVWWKLAGEQTISMTFEPDGPNGTRIMVAGEGPRKVRRAFAKLAEA